MRALEQLEIQFSAPALGPADYARLGAQRTAVWAVISGGGWWTLRELSEASGGHPEASCSARLRDFRRPEHGGCTILRRRRFGADRGTFEYSLGGE